MGGSSSLLLPDGVTSGYHILRVLDNSPGQKEGLEAFFDFIIAIDNVLVEDNDNIKEILLVNKDKPLRLRIFSTKFQGCRDVTLTPNNQWGGQGLMGISIRYCPIDKANENVWHILQVEPKSPAELAGLKPFSDYVIGADSILNDRDDFFDMIDASDGQLIRLYVYNSESDLCRELRIKPDSNWGGNGLLGCDIGYGYLHRIPITVPELKNLNPVDQTITEKSSTITTQINLTQTCSTPTNVNQQINSTSTSNSLFSPYPQPITFTNSFSDVPLVNDDNMKNLPNIQINPTLFNCPSNIPLPIPLPTNFSHMFNPNMSSTGPVYGTNVTNTSCDSVPNLPCYLPHMNFPLSSPALISYPEPPLYTTIPNLKDLHIKTTE